MPSLTWLCLLFPSPTSLFLEFIGDPTPPGWKGYLLAVLMFLAACLQTLFEQQHVYRLKVLQMRLRTAITGLVYRKVSLGLPLVSIPPRFTCTRSSQEGLGTSLNCSYRPCLKTCSFVTSFIAACSTLSPPQLFL